MKFDEIAENIKDGGNIYENEQGIKTLKVTEWKRINEQIHLFLGFKKEETCVVMTVFIGFKKGVRNPNSEWWWLCPGKRAINGFSKEIISLYFKIDETNNKIRKNPDYSNNRALILSLLKETSEEPEIKVELEDSEN